MGTALVGMGATLPQEIADVNGIIGTCKYSAALGMIYGSGEVESVGQAFQPAVVKYRSWHAGRNCLKMVDFVTPYVGAVREPPDIRALLEAPLHQKSGGT
jgi:hypothetical protein